MKPTLKLPTTIVQSQGSDALIDELGRVFETAAKHPYVSNAKGEKVKGGAVLVQGMDDEGCRLVWIRKTQQNPGYPTSWNFPRGGQEEGDSVEATAEREAEEEMGLKPSGLDPLVTMSIGGNEFHFFIGAAKGPSTGHDKETEKVELVPWEEALKRFAQYGNQRDISVAKTAIAWLEKKGLDPLGTTGKPGGPAKTLAGTSPALDQARAIVSTQIRTQILDQIQALKPHEDDPAIKKFRTALKGLVAQIDIAIAKSK